MGFPAVDAPSPEGVEDRVCIVIVTRDRSSLPADSLRRALALPDAPDVVVDDASDDDTTAAVAERFPTVTLTTLSRSRGAAARNFGVEGPLRRPWGGAPGGAAHPRGASGEGLGYGPELVDELTMVKVVHPEPGVPRASS